MTDRKARGDFQLLNQGLTKLPEVLEFLGIQELREGQREPIYNLMSGVDTIVVLPTGLGKSLVYTVPTLCHGWRTILFSPLVALMQDQVQGLWKKGVKAAQLTGMQSAGENDLALQDWIAGDVQMLFSAPERLDSPAFLEAMTQQPPDFAVIDECFTGDVEILTEHGFVRFDELEDDTRCAQYNVDSGSISFTLPEKYIRKPYKGPMVNLVSDRTVDLSMTPNHELVLVNTRTGEIKKKRCSDCSLSDYWNMPVASKYEGAVIDNTLTPEEKLQFMFQADGSWHSKTSGLYSLTKQRKIDRFLQICKELGLEPHPVKSKKPRKKRFTLNHGDIQVSKRLSELFRLEDLTKEKARSIVDEVARWDGSDLRTWKTPHNMLYYCSSIEENVDFIQAVAILAGFKAFKCEQKDPRSETYKVMHRLYIDLNKSHVGTQRAVRSTYDYEGQVYCVRVPDGNIVVRRNGKPVVVGNCHVGSQWSDNFRHHYVKIGDFIDQTNPRVVMACTATAPSEVVRDTRRIYRLEDATLWKYLPRRTNLNLSSRPFYGYQDLADQLRKIDGSCIVYCATVKEVVETTANLQSLLPSEVITLFHGQLKDTEKQSNMKLFMDDRARVVVCTNAFGMGIDKPDIRGVIHRNYPGSPEALSQECVHPESMISTAAGQLPAKKVVLGEKMIDTDFVTGKVTPSKITKTMTNHTTELIEIRTKLGSTLRITKDHPVYLLQEETLVETPGGGVQQGDWVLAQKNLAPADTHDPDIIEWLLDCPEPVYIKVTPELVDRVRSVLSVETLRDGFELKRLYDYNAYKKGLGAQLIRWLRVCEWAGVSREELLDNILGYKTKISKLTQLPRKVTSELSWLAGIMASDGYIYRAGPGETSGYGSWKLKLGNTDPRIITRFEEIITSMGLSVHTYERKPTSTSLAKKVITLAEVSSPILVHLMGKMGVPAGKKTYKVEVPKWLYTASEGVRAGYLAGALDGDGSIPDNRYSFRFHAAQWSFVSSMAYLFRSFSIPATCYSEDYLCKRDVMTAASDCGYSMFISSTVDYERARELIQPHSCKTWMRKRKPHKEVYRAAHRKSRRPQHKALGQDWLIDEVVEVLHYDYKGEVLNWTVEPGNQLVVEGLLTHNCGRASRDGQPATCITMYDDDSRNVQEYFFEMANPSESLIRKVYQTLSDESQGGTRPVKLTLAQIAGRCGTTANHVTSVIETLSGAGCISRENNSEKVAKIRIRRESDHPAFTRATDLIRKAGHPDGQGFIQVNLQWLADEMDRTVQTVTNYLRNWDRENAIEYQPPYRGAVTQVVGPLTLVDFGRLKDKARREREKLEKMTDYLNTPDDQKHEWLEDYFEVSNTEA